MVILDSTRNHCLAVSDRRIRGFRNYTNPMENSILVIGGGIAGIQASLDLANAGYHVYLVEKAPSIGGLMAMLDKTYPTMDCSI